MIQYAINIFWSGDDRAYVAEAPDLPGCMAHGTTYEDALSNALEAIVLWVRTAEQQGRPVPKPRSRRLSDA